MDTQLTPSTETNYCQSCSAQAAVDDQFCAGCGYPLKGTEEEQKTFLMNKSYKELNLDEANRQVKRASYALYYVAGATLVSGLILYGLNKDGSQSGAVLLINVMIAAIFAAIGFWCTRKPLAGIITGASLYALIVILNAVSNPLTIMSGIIFKIFIVGCFIRGIKAALEAEKLKKELNIG